MSTKTKLSEFKQPYCKAKDAVLRGFYNYLRSIAKDAAAAQADADAESAKADAEKAADASKAAAKRAADLKRAAKKDAAKQEAAQKAQQEADAAKQSEAEAKAEQTRRAEAAKRAAAEAAKDAARAEDIANLREVMQRKGLRAEDFTKDYLLRYLPQRFNEAQQICKVTRIEDADAAEAREKYPNMIVEKDGILYCYLPQQLFTANGVLSLFMSAADAKAKAAKEAAQQISAAERERKAAEREAKRYAEAKRRVQEYEAKQQQEAAAAQN